MYIIEERHVNGDYSFTKVRTKVIKGKKLAEYIKFELELSTIEQATLMEYKIVKVEAVKKEADFFTNMEFKN